MDENGTGAPGTRRLDKASYKEYEQMTYAELIKSELRKHTKRPQRHIESHIQRNIVKWFRLKYPRYIISAVPNGGARQAREAAILKQEGVLAGFADLIIIADNSVLFVEVKTEKGKQSEKQKDFQKRVNTLGFEYIIVRSLDNFICSTEKWLNSRLYC